MFDKLKKVRPHKLFLIIAIPVGVFFALFTPLFQGPDEPHHFMAIAMYSNGYTNIINESGVYGTRVQSGTVEILNFYPHLQNNTSYNYRSEIPPLLGIKQGEARSSFTKQIGEPYSPFCYIQYIAIYILSSLLKLNPFLMFIFMRLVGLALWVTAVYYSIKIIPKGKWLLTSLALLPMSLFIAAVISADNMTTGLLYLAVATIFYIISKPREINNNKLLIGVIAILFLLGLTKQTFFLATLLLFAIPISKSISKIKFYTIIAFVAVMAAVLSLSWKVYVSPHNLSPSPNQVINSYSQVVNLISHPLLVPKIIFNTFATSSSNPIYLGIIGVMGLLDTTLPLWIVFAWIIVLVKSVNNRINNDMLAVNQKIIFTGVAALLFISMCLGLYLTWTSVGAHYINGIQGRYLIPIFVVLIPVLVSSRKEPTLNTIKFLIPTIVILEISTMAVFIARYT